MKSGRKDYAKNYNEAFCPEKCAGCSEWSEVLGQCWSERKGRGCVREAN